MTTISRNKLFDRWDTLPDDLREAIFSEVNSDFLWKTCEAEHIPNGKISDVAKVMGYVLMGFLHPEDIAQELKEGLSLDMQTANSIEAALNKRIFAPLRPDIDKVYAPISKLESPSATVASPKIIQDVSVAPPKPAQSLPAVGWSQMKPPAAAASTPPRPAVLPPTPISAPIASTPKPAPAEPAPMILHEDTTFKAVQKNADFTLSRPGGGAEMHMGSGSGAPAPARPAVLEFGGAPAKPPATQSQSGAVHYTDFKSPLSANPTANAGPRNVTQITPAAPAAPAQIPAVIPKPPSPPQPPQAQTPAPAPAPQQNTKPIVKDFL
jgi:hypothetical protein